MSGILLAVYFAVGVLLMTVAIATRKKRPRDDSLAPVDEDDPVGAGLFVVVVLFWPIWLVAEFFKGDKGRGASEDKR